MPRLRSGLFRSNAREKPLISSVLDSPETVQLIFPIGSIAFAYREHPCGFLACFAMVID